MIAMAKGFMGSVYTESGVPSRGIARKSILRYCSSGKEIGDVHSPCVSDVPLGRPRARDDAVKGILYACEWLQDPIAGDYPGHEPRPIVASRTRALWVPEASILLQWPVPRGPVQISERDSFPPSGEEARVALIGTQSVPYAVIRQARRHLVRAAHLHAQQAVLQKAMDRLTQASISSEGQVQAALTEAGIQQF